MIRNIYTIPDDFYKEAADYALASRAFTSDRHDFHSGTLNDKQRKMFEGKLGEKAFKMMLIDNNFSFEEDHTSPFERDEYDFILTKPNSNSISIDVKTRTKKFHSRTLEMVEQYTNHPKDIYISARLYKKNDEETSDEEARDVKLLGWFTGKEMKERGKIENQGYKDNYVMYDSELRPMEDFLTFYSDYIKKETPPSDDEDVEPWSALSECEQISLFDSV